MPDSIFFASFDPLQNTRCACSLCFSSLPRLNYEIRTEDENGDSQYAQGFCCPACAAMLLEKLEGSKSKERAEEEALEAELIFTT
jgi:hypothetical protein